MSSTETLTFIQIREQGAGNVQSLKLESGATFRNALNQCDFIDRPEDYEMTYYDKDGQMVHPDLDEAVEDHAYKEDQEFLASFYDDVG